MSRALKKLRICERVDAAMFVLNLVFLSLLAISASVQAGFPRYVQGRWILADDNPQYGGTDEQSLTDEDTAWSTSPTGVGKSMTLVEQYEATTADSNTIKEQELDKVEESSVWKVVLVVGVLLMAVVGSVSTIYYYCVWRGGRIHYQAQKEGYS